jgi:hypothetical protein
MSATDLLPAAETARSCGSGAVHGSGSFFWERYAYTKDKREWNNRRLARARQAVGKEADAMPLFPELRRFNTVEDRVMMMDEREIRLTNQMRNARAAMWRDARAMIRSLNADQREQLKAKWNTRFMPGTPAHLFACAKLIGVHTHNQFLSQNQPSLTACRVG